MIYIYIIRTCYKRWIEVLPKLVAVTFLLGILPNFQLPLLKVSRASHHIFSTYMYRYKLCMYKWNKYIDLKRKLIHVNTCIYILRGMIEPPKAQNCFADWFWEAGCSQIVGVVSIAGVAAWECQDCEASHTCTCRRATILVTSWCCDWETLWLDHFTTLFDLLVLEFWSFRWPPMILNDSCVKKQIENLPNEVWRCGGQVSCVFTVESCWVCQNTYERYLNVILNHLCCIKWARSQNWPGA